MATIGITRKCAFVAASYLASLSLVLALSGSCDGTDAHHVIRFEGTKLLRDTVQPHATDVWTIRLRAFRPAELIVEAETGANRLECVLIDPEKRPHQPAKGGTNSCRVAWTPVRSGPYRLEVTNQHDVPHGYTVLLR